MYFIIVNPDSKFVSFTNSKHDICFGHTSNDVIKEYTNQQYADDFGHEIINVPYNTEKDLYKMPRYDGIKKMTVKEYMQQNCRMRDII